MFLYLFVIFFQNIFNELDPQYEKFTKVSDIKISSIIDWDSFILLSHNLKPFIKDYSEKDLEDLKDFNNFLLDINCEGMFNTTCNTLLYYLFIVLLNFFLFF